MHRRPDDNPDDSQEEALSNEKSLTALDYSQPKPAKLNAFAYALVECIGAISLLIGSSFWTDYNRKVVVGHRRLEPRAT